MNTKKTLKNLNDTERWNVRSPCFLKSDKPSMTNSIYSFSFKHASIFNIDTFKLFMRYTRTAATSFTGEII